MPSQKSDKGNAGDGFVNPFENPNIGRRTGIDIRAGKNIRKFEDGFENFDDFWSDSDEMDDTCDEWLKEKENERKNKKTLKKSGKKKEPLGEMSSSKKSAEKPFKVDSEPKSMSPFSSFDQTNSIPMKVPAEKGINQEGTVSGSITKEDQDLPEGPNSALKGFVTRKRLTFSSAEKEQAATPKQQVNVNKEMDVEEDFDDTLTENTDGYSQAEEEDENVKTPQPQNTTATAKQSENIQDVGSDSLTSAASQEGTSKLLEGKETGEKPCKKQGGSSAEQEDCEEIIDENQGAMPTIAEPVQSKSAKQKYKAKSKQDNIDVPHKVKESVEMEIDSSDTGHELQLENDESGKMQAPDKSGAKKSSGRSKKVSDDSKLKEKVTGGNKKLGNKTEELQLESDEPTKPKATDKGKKSTTSGVKLKADEVSLNVKATGRSKDSDTCTAENQETISEAAKLSEDLNDKNKLEQRHTAKVQKKTDVSMKNVNNQTGPESEEGQNQPDLLVPDTQENASQDEVVSGVEKESAELVPKTTGKGNDENEENVTLVESSKESTAMIPKRSMRGRNTSKADTSVVESAALLPKRSTRGRSKKKVEVSEVESSQDTAELAPKRTVRGRDKIESNASVEESSQESRDLAPKRTGRGRNKKEVDASQVESIQEKVDLVPKRTGRSRNRKDESIVETSVLEPKRTGRGKKKETADISVVESSLESTGIVPKRTGRGKNKKEESETLAEASEEHKDLVPKRTGRNKNKKQDTIQVVESSQESVNLVPRRTGRSRKNQSDTLTESSQESSIVASSISSAEAALGHKETTAENQLQGKEEMFQFKLLESDVGSEVSADSAEKLKHDVVSNTSLSPAFQSDLSRKLTKGDSTLVDEKKGELQPKRTGGRSKSNRKMGDSQTLEVAEAVVSGSLVVKKTGGKGSQSRRSMMYISDDEETGGQGTGGEENFNKRAILEDSQDEGSKPTKSRKRGRQSKKDVVEEKADHQSGVHSKDIAEAENEEVKLEAKKTGGRGRPKKNAAEKVDGEDSKLEPKKTGGRGRSGKNAPQEAKDGEDSKLEPKKTGGRGRPGKNAQQEGKDSKDSKLEPKKTGGRGRPSKNALQEAKDGGDSLESKKTSGRSSKKTEMSPKKSGRQQKQSKKKSMHEGDDEIPEVLPKKRKRRSLVENNTFDVNAIEVMKDDESEGDEKDEWEPPTGSVEQTEAMEESGSSVIVVDVHHSADSDLESPEPSVSEDAAPHLTATSNPSNDPPVQLDEGEQQDGQSIKDHQNGESSNTIEPKDFPRVADEMLPHEIPKSAKIVVPVKDAIEENLEDREDSECNFLSLHPVKSMKNQEDEALDEDFEIVDVPMPLVASAKKSKKEEKQKGTRKSSKKAVAEKSPSRYDGEEVNDSKEQQHQKDETTKAMKEKKKSSKKAVDEKSPSREQRKEDDQSGHSDTDGEHTNKGGKEKTKAGGKRKSNIKSSKVSEETEEKEEVSAGLPKKQAKRVLQEQDGKEEEEEENYEFFSEEFFAQLTSPHLHRKKVHQTPQVSTIEELETPAETPQELPSSSSAKKNSSFKKSVNSNKGRRSQVSFQPVIDEEEDYDDVFADTTCSSVLSKVDKSAVQIAKKAAVEETPGEKKSSSSSSSSASETKDQHTGAKGKSKKTKTTKGKKRNLPPVEDDPGMDDADIILSPGPDSAKKQKLQHTPMHSRRNSGTPMSAPRSILKKGGSSARSTQKVTIGDTPRYTHAPKRQLNLDQTDYSLASMSTASPQHFHEMIPSNTPVITRPEPKSKILSPEAPPASGVRRSQRTRVESLEWYKNERIIYDRRKSGGVVVKAINKPLEDNKPAKKKKMKKKRRGPPATPKNMSMHEEPSPYWSVSEEVEVPVVNPVDGVEVLVECINKKDANYFVGPTGQDAQPDDPLITCKTIQQKAFAAGKLNLRPHSEKGTQFVRNDSLVFYILHGKLAVTIHRQTSILESGDTFFIPRGNTYSIKNMRNEEAKMVFYQHKG